MNHYFEYNPDLKLEYFDIKVSLNGVEFDLISSSNVFSNRVLDEGSKIMMKVLTNQELRGSLLDLGCGYGPIGIYLKKVFPNLSITMSDINPLCCELTKNNLKRLNISDIEVVQSDSFENISKKFDYVIFNPPISVGKKIIYKMYMDTYEHMSNNGHLLIVIRKNKGALSHKEYLSSLYPSTSVIYKDKGYFIIECIK